MIKSFKIFESNLEIEKICKDLGIRKFQIVDGLVNVDGDVNISDKKLKKIPIKFGSVGGNFWCNNNKLTRLEGAPQSVGGNFWCRNNQLTTLEGAPGSVGGDFNCDYNDLKSLKGGPNWVGGDFSCDSNYSLTTLEGFPEKVVGSFWCQYNGIWDFRGIRENSLAEYNKFVCRENPIYEIYKLFENSECIDLINEFEVIRDGNVIIKDRLEEVFYTLGMEIPEKLEFKNYRLI